MSVGLHQIIGSDGMHLEKVRKFIENDHKEIEGWFFSADQYAFLEIFALQERLKIKGNICEVGVYQGKSLVLLSLLKNDGDKLYGFDLFANDDLSITKNNVAKYGIDDNLQLEKGLTTDLSIEAMDSFFTNPLRFLHIDAGHEYHEVLSQLEMFAPYLSDTGVIVMDDYQDREFPGIEAAVLDFCEINRPRRFVPFLASGNKMFLCNVSYAAAFIKSLVVQKNFKDRSRLTRVRDFNILIMESKLAVSSKDVLDQIDRTTFPARYNSKMVDLDEAKKLSQLEFGSGH